MTDHRARDPRPLRESLAALQRELGLAEPDLVARLRTAWPELVGAALARHAAVSSLRAGACTVVVDDPAYATRLRYLEPAIVEWVRTAGGTESVVSVRVVVARPGTTLP